MFRILLAGALVLTATSPAAQPKAADREKLLRLAERMDRAWTAADADANADLFATNATARFGDDPLGEGREAIRDQFRTFFKDRPPGLRHVTRIERIEQLGHGFATWDAEVRVERLQANGEWSALSRIRNVTLAVRQPDGWRIRMVRAFPVQ
jgi:uncharacterized protein (TIGR02246 family)